MPPDLTLQAALIAALILLNAFFAATEIAIVSVRRSRLRYLVEEERDQRAAAVKRLVEQPAHFLATIQVGATLAGFFASAVSAVSLVAVLGAWLETVPLAVIAANARAIALVAVTVALSFVTLILGELAPKNLAIVHAEAIALRVGRPLELLSKLAAPVLWILVASTSLVMRLTGSPERARVPPLTEEEILAIVASGEEEGVVAPMERKLIGEVLEFGETTVAEVMVPRVDVQSLPKSATLADAHRAVIQSGHTRLPVYDGSVDNIVGVIHAKDLLQHVDAATLAQWAQRPVTTITRPAYLVPHSKPVSELLVELQRQRLHLAVAVDEFGGTAGIVTLNDLLEELVGPINDEFSGQEEPEIQVMGEGELVVRGSADLDDVEAALDVELRAEGVDTIGGLVYARLGRIPREGDVVVLPQAVVEVLAMRGKRVWRARVTGRERTRTASSATS